MDSHTSRASRGEGASTQARAYGRKLEHLFDKAGAARKDLAEFGSYHPSAITRYFQGKRIAPREFLPVFREFLKSQGVLLDDAEFGELDTLRRLAQESSTGHGDQAALSRERIAELEREVARLMEQMELRQDQEAVDDDLRQVAQAVAQEYQHTQSEGAEAGRAEPFSQLADEIKVLSGRIEELQRLRSQDGQAVPPLGFVPTGYHVHHTLMGPPPPPPPFRDEHPIIALIGFLLVGLFFYGVGASFGIGILSSRGPWEITRYIAFAPVFVLLVVYTRWSLGALSRMANRRWPAISPVFQERLLAPRSKKAVLLCSGLLAGYGLEPFLAGYWGALIGLGLFLVWYLGARIFDEMREDRRQSDAPAPAGAGHEDAPRNVDQ
ncbi:hypothetical protein [Streptomyces sp. NPDC051183]|uniref:hypothetical protein n=1 Tax=Streptomyces sp. NPDC051183 TaxID=3155165 RepID=UPI0034489A11